MPIINYKYIIILISIKITLCQQKYKHLIIINKKIAMNDILTLQQISDIDTFTLEQKIEQLQQHPLAAMYEQLIAIAKLQLTQRIKVQEFGRMLINDQIPIFPDITVKSSENIINRKQASKSQRKMQFAQCLKRSLISDQKQLTIGRPTLGNYRYVPKQTINSSRQKKKSIVEQKKTYNNKKPEQKRSSLVSKPPIPLPSIKQSRNFAQNQSKLSKNSQKNRKSSQQTLSSNKSSKSVPNCQIKQQQKVKIQSPMKGKIKYIQNDVYDGQKMILDRPQKLADIKLDTQSEIQVSLEQNKETEEEEWRTSNTQEVKIQQKTIKLQQQYQKKQEKTQSLPQQFKIQQNQLIKQQQQMKVLQNTIQLKKFINNTPQYSKLQDLTQQRQQQQIKNCLNYSNFQQLHQKSSIQPKRNKQLLTQINLQKQSPIKNQTKSIVQSNKAKSISHIPKSTKTLSIFSNNIDQTDELAIIIPKLNQNKQITQNNNQSQTIANLRKPKKIISFNITNEPTKEVRTQRETIRPNPSPTFNYHQVISSFNRLFPHSSSLINDLRSIQRQLSDHINKKINQISLADQYLKIRQNQLLFKVVSETEKARKYKNQFDINLDSFFKRSQIMIDRIKKNNQNPVQNQILLYRVVRQREDVYDIINNSFHRSYCWYELPHGMDLKTSWNLLWTWSKPQIDLRQLFYFQKVNHFFGNKQIARKDLLKKNIQRIKKLGPKAKAIFDIIPQTYYLPGQNMQFVRKFREYSVKPGLNYWIMKPVGLSRGRGISLVTQIQQIVFNQPIVLQKYLQNPLLLEGYKFDMRIYVLVTSINPLQAYVYKQGFARISTEKYSLQDENVGNKFIHLTNFSVQKQNLQHDQKPKQIQALNALQKQLGGCKITLKTLKNKLAFQGIKWQTIQPQIDSIVLKSLISTMNVIQPNPNCFELFGYDIIIDQNLKCWLLEVNSSPSLEKDFTIDEIVKQQLVDDIIQIVDPLPYDRQRLLEVVTRRRKQLQGLKSHINTQNNSYTQLNADLHYILNGRPLRRYGQACGNKNFKRIAPGEVYQNIIKTVQSYKLTSITKQQQV